MTIFFMHFNLFINGENCELWLISVRNQNLPNILFDPRQAMFLVHYRHNVLICCN